MERELKRLRTPFEAARNDGYTRFIMFLHYPPTNILEWPSGFTDMAEEYGADRRQPAHCRSAETVCRNEGRHARANFPGVDAAQVPNVVPIPGSKNKARIVENLNASNVELTDEEFSALEASLNQCRVFGHRGLGGF